MTGWRRPWRRLAVAALLGAGLCGSAIADIDSSAYDAGGAIRSEAQREAMRRQMDAERAAEQRREAEAAQREAELQAQREARQAARPFPERLLEARCTACHDASNYAGKRHTVLGWHLVMLRMRYLNGAVIDAEERGLIRDQLLRQHGPTRAEWVIEFGALGLASAAAAALPWLLRRVLRRRRRR
jgi:hypothetical protein